MPKISNKKQQKEDESRPKRSRKPTNFEGHYLHWIEETQLHKALMKSLKDKKKNGSTNSTYESDDCSTNISNIANLKMPRVSVAIVKSEEDNVVIKFKKFSEKVEKLSPMRRSNRSKVTRSRFSYTDKNDPVDLCTHHAAMMQPLIVLPINECEKLQNAQMEESTSSAVENHGLKTRAQRKFPCNAITPFEGYSRASNCDQCKMENKSKYMENGNSSGGLTQSNLIQTDTFLNYLCFRNTEIGKQMFPNGLQTI